MNNTINLMNSKCYKVSVYSVDHKDNMGKIEYVDKIIVKKNPFDVEEIVTGEHIKIEWDLDKVMESNNILPSILNTRFFEQRGYVFVVQKEDLKEINLANKGDMDRYVDSFNDSDYKKFIDRAKTKNKSLIKR